METKLKALMIEKGIRQKDLINIIEQNTGYIYGRDRISRLCTGKTKNYSMETAVILSQALGVSIDQIVEITEVKKNEKNNNTRNIL